MGKPKNPSDDIAILHHEIGRIFRNLLSEEGLFDKTDFPSIDILERGDTLRIEIEIPGLDKAEIKLEVSGDSLVIEGTKRDSEDAERTSYICMERRFGYFRREITLPAIGDAGQIKADHRNGILTIIIPKLIDRRKTTKRIEIE